MENLSENDFIEGIVARSDRVFIHYLRENSAMVTKPCGAYAELISQAELAVEHVEDAEYRRIAFAKILESLIAGIDSRQLDSATKATDRSPIKQKRSSDRGDLHAVRAGPQAYVLELVQEIFFKTPKSIGEVRTELKNRGHHVEVTSLSGPLQKLCQRKVLRRAKHSEGNKDTYCYSNW